MSEEERFIQGEIPFSDQIQLLRENKSYLKFVFTGAPMLMISSLML